MTWFEDFMKAFAVMVGVLLWIAFAVMVNESMGWVGLTVYLLFWLACAGYATGRWVYDRYVT